MTDQDVIRRLQAERPPLPDGFAQRHDRLLHTLNAQERKVNMKKLIAAALVALMLLGSAAYAATHIDLAALFHGSLTQDQLAYVDAATQSAQPVSVRMGGHAREDYRLDTLRELPLTAAYIDNITVFKDGDRLLIGFTRSAAGEGKSFSLDSVFVADTPRAVLLREASQGEQSVYWLEAWLPDTVASQPLTITLPLALAGEEDAFQFITFTAAESHVQATLPVTLPFNEHLSIRLGRGSLSPLGLCIPMEVVADQCVEIAIFPQAALDEGESVYGGLVFNFRDVADASLAHSLRVSIFWLEYGDDGQRLLCNGEATIDLAEGTVKRLQVHVFPHTASDDDAPLAPYDGQPQDADVPPQRLTLRARGLTEEGLMAIAADVLGDVSGYAARPYPEEEALGTAYFAPDEAAASQEPSACARYIPGSASLYISRLASYIIPNNGETIAPLCPYSAQEAADLALAWITETFGIPAEDLALEGCTPIRILADQADGYQISISQRDAGMTRFLKHYDSTNHFASPTWCLAVASQGIVEVRGRLWEVTSAQPIENALTAEQAWAHVTQARADGLLGGLPDDSCLTGVSAATLSQPAAAYGERIRYPVWVFTWQSNGNTWQVCVDRATGEVIPTNLMNYICD